MHNPLVSVIMPVYNTEKYLAEAVDSILTQTYPAIELICIDDASTDNSEKVLDRYGAKTVRARMERNGGIAAARNKSIPLARGVYIAFADADDIWHPEKLAKQIALLEARPDLDIAFSMIENFISPDIPTEIKNTRRFPAGHIEGQISGTFVARRKSFDLVGPLSEEYRIGEFIDWMTRAAEQKLAWASVPEVLYRRRVHETNTTLDRSSQQDYLRIARAAIARKRIT